MVDRPGAESISGAEVEIDGTQVDGWTEITLPSQTTEAGEYRDGDDPAYEKKIWGQTTLGTLTMERELLSSDETVLWEWSQKIRQGDTDGGRRSLEITFFDGEGGEHSLWTFEGAWIQHYEPPGLDTSNDETAKERIVVAFGAMKREEL